MTPVDPVAPAPIEAEFGQILDAGEVIVEESKKGYKTTEFWLTVVSVLATATGTIPTPHDAKGYVAAALVLVYALSRGLAKKGVANVTPVS